MTCSCGVWSPKRNIQKEKIEKKIRDENISSILSFIYWVKGLTNATSWDVAWCPKHQTAKWCCWFDGHCLKEKDNIVSFFKRNAFFSFAHASSPFPLETSGSFFKFNSFLFIYFFYFFIFYLLICSQHSPNVNRMGNKLQSFYPI